MLIAKACMYSSVCSGPCFSGRQPDICPILGLQLYRLASCIVVCTYVSLFTLPSLYSHSAMYPALRFSGRQLGGRGFVASHAGCYPAEQQLQLQRWTSFCTRVTDCCLVGIDFGSTNVYAMFQQPSASLLCIVTQELVLLWLQALMTGQASWT